MRELNGKEAATCLVVLLVVMLIVGDGNSIRNTIIRFDYRYLHYCLPANSNA